MHRRRFPRRELPEQRIRYTVNSSPRLYMQTANQLFAQGQFLQAARIYEGLGHEAQMRGFVERSPFLYIQASRAFFMAHQGEAGAKLLRYGIRQLTEIGRWRAASRIGQVSAVQVRAVGYEKTADEFLKWLGNLLAEHPGIVFMTPSEDPLPIEREQPYHPLPEKCPYCGAGLRLDGIDTIDPARIECPFCGSPVSI